MENDIAESPALFNAWTWIEKNRTQLVIGVVVVVGAGLVFGYTVASQKASRVAAGEALSNALLAQISSGSQAQSGENLLKVSAEHPGTPAGAQALLLGAGALFASGKHAEAQAQFEKFTRDYAADPLVPQARLGVAASLAALGKSEEAVKAYKELTERYPAANTLAQARFSLAGLYESQNKLEEALGLYEQVANSERSSGLGQEAGMRAEEVRLKLPPIQIPVESSTTIGAVTNAGTPVAK